MLCDLARRTEFEQGLLLGHLARFDASGLDMITDQ